VTRLAWTWLLLIVVAACAARGPTGVGADVSNAIERLRASGNLLSLSPADQRLVYPHMDKTGRTTRVPRSGSPSRLGRAEKDLSQFRYTHAETTRTLDDFMRALNVVGVIAVKDDVIVLERYADGHDGDTPWISFSIAKSVTSLLFGVAVHNGHISSLDEGVTRFLPDLAGSAYDSVTLRHLLQMSSGVAWNPDMADLTSDTYRLGEIDKQGGFAGLLAFMKAKPRLAPPGQKFTYNTADADLAGAVLRRATRRSLSDYLAAHIWQPYGMEADAHWLTMRGDRLERGSCCLSATLRDYARLGQLALHDGIGHDGTRILPEGWMAESTRSSPAFPGYGYYWWLRKSGSYFASGSFGQHIEVDPSSRTVIAIQSYWPKAYSDELIKHNDTFVAALIAALR
jgi:CubicO group peptidase (beta-lactamase class C family)